MFVRCVTHRTGLDCVGMRVDRQGRVLVGGSSDRWWGDRSEIFASPLPASASPPHHLTPATGHDASGPGLAGVMDVPHSGHTPDVLPHGDKVFRQSVGKPNAIPRIRVSFPRRSMSESEVLERRRVVPVTASQGRSRRADQHACHSDLHTNIHGATGTPNPADSAEHLEENRTVEADLRAPASIRATRLFEDVWTDADSSLR